MKQTIPRIAATIVFAISARAADLTIDQAWKQIAAYKVGESRAAWQLLEAHIAETSVQPKARQESEAGLIAILRDGTDDAKLFACQQLGRVGSDAAVAEVAKLLAKGDRRVVQMACLALAGIGGEPACRELRNAVGRAGAGTLPDIAHALGVLRDANSAAALAGKLGDGSGAAGETVAWALAEIGTTEAGDALLKLGAKPASVAVTNAQLRCVERLATGDGKSLAQRICDLLWQADLSVAQRGAALRSMVVAGHARSASLVLEAMGSEQPRLAGTAANLLPQALATGSVDDVLARFADLAPATQARVLDVLAETGRREVLPVAMKCLQSEDASLRLAAIRALGMVGDASHVRTLAELAAESEDAGVRAAAVAGLGRLNAKGADEAILGLLKQGDDNVRQVLVDAAVQRGSAGLVPVLWEMATKAPALRKSVFKALGKAADDADFAKLITYLREDLDAGTRSALEDAIAAVGRRLDDPRVLRQALYKSKEWTGGGSREAYSSVVRILGRMGGAGPLQFVREILREGDADHRLEAIRALAAWPDTGAVDDLVALAENKDDKIGHTLAVRGLMRLVDQQIGTVAEQLSIVEQLGELSDDPAVRDWAAKQRDGMLKEKAGTIALQRLPARSAQRKEELAKSAEKGWRVVAYVDCGPDTRDGAKGKPSLRVAAGKPWVWEGSHRHGDIRAGTVAFDGTAVRVDAAGLDPAKSYRVGLTWWDYDGNGRVQAIRLSGKQVLKATPLPSHKKRQPPATVVVDVPAELYSSRKMLIEVRGAGGPNAVLSEIWLYEADQKPKRAQVVKPKPRDPNAKPILLQTGEDYKGHKWRLTTPVLEEALSKDARLAVDVVEDLMFLRSPKLHEYAAIVMHFKNYDPEVPGRKGYDNLASFVEKGGGLVLVHFACGAFQEFRDEFVKLAGQAWNPKLRGHDPFGTFKVNFTKTDHPVTRGMADFETTDELYTCLEGDTPMTVLASAVSKVDKKVYPMVFALDYGKGRVLHCVLGHDEGSLRNPPVAELFRRATAWVAGLEPVK